MHQSDAVQSIRALLANEEGAGGRAWLAPMAGITDRAFRLLCKEQGCGLTCTEMVSAKGLHYGGERTVELLALDPVEVPAAVQIFGSHPTIMADQAARLCDELGATLALIDINMGCPAPKITGNGEGAALMRTPELAADIVRAVSRASRVPVTAKFRKGWDDTHLNAVDFACRLQDAGAAAVGIHGRTRMQFYAGSADWDAIRAVKEALDIPVLGNGDVFSAQNARDLLDATGVDGLLVARGAQGNPWIFAQIRAFLERGEVLPPPCPAERADMALRHARLLVQFKGDRAIVEMRKHAAFYLTGLPGAAALRAQVNRINALGELEDILESWKFAN